MSLNPANHGLSIHSKSMKTLNPRLHPIVDTLSNTVSVDSFRDSANINGVFLPEPITE